MNSDLTQNATEINQQDPLDLISAGETTKSHSKDHLAEQEAKHKFSDGERGEKFRRHVHRVVLSGIYVVAICILAMIIVRAWHFISPDCGKWLDDKECHDLERIIFSGAIVSLAGSYFKRYNLLDKRN